MSPTESFKDHRQNAVRLCCQQKPSQCLRADDMTTLGGDDATGQDEFKQGASSESKVHVRVQQRNGRKCITTVQVCACVAIQSSLCHSHIDL